MDYLKLTEYYKQLESTTKRLEKTEIISRLLRELKKESNPEPALNLLRGKVFPDWEERKIGVSEKLVIIFLLFPVSFLLIVIMLL